MAWLTLVRHGESQWNLEQRFTGWADVELTPRGIEQMRNAGEVLRRQGVELDVAYSSTLTRCIRSLWVLLETMGCVWVPHRIDWRLNERHYGALTGRLKIEAEKEYGAAAVRRWRRTYDAQPPALDAASVECVKLDRRYAGLDASRIPSSESLRQTVARVSEAWRESIVPTLQMGQSVAIVAHGNSLRALTKIIEGLSDSEIARVEIGNGEPCIYELDTAFNVRGKCVLAQAIRSTSDIL